MKKIINLRRVFSSLILFVLAFYVIGLFNIVTAEANGIGSISDTYSRTIVEGATYTFTDSSNGSPQKNYVLEYDPKKAPVEALAVYGNYAFGGDTLSSNVSLAESKGYTVIAGINGSPFDTSNGLTVGTLISNGIIISAADGSSSYDSFAIKEDGSMFISNSNLTFKYQSGEKEVQVNYINKQKKSANEYIYLITSDYYTNTTTLVNSTEVVLSIKSGSVSIGEQLICTVDEVNNSTMKTKVEEGKVVLVGPSIEVMGNLQIGAEVTFDFINNDDRYNWDDVTQSICGFYEILKDGQYVNTTNPEVHPRTTVGFKEDGTIVLYVVDGRQPNFSVGLTDLTCAQYMKSLGCVAAIRMDGGGSSTMGLRLPGDSHISTINSPSDGSERNDADGLLLVLKSDFDQTVGEETLLHAYPNNVKLLQNTVIDLTVKATDAKYNPKDVPEYKIEVLDNCGTIIGDNKFQAKTGSGTGKIKISSVNASTFVNVSITDEVDELYATVNNLALAPNDKVSLSVKAYNNKSLLICSNEAFTWSCSPEIGTIDNKGNFVASEIAGVSGTIEVSYGNVKASVVVTVGQLPVEITGFENDTCGSGTGQWQNTQINGGSGSCSINTDLTYVKYGEKSLKINFNLAGTTGTVGTQISNGSYVQIEGTPTAIGMWVYATPSAQGAWIRMQYRESNSTAAKYADFGNIDWIGWKYLEAEIEEGLSYPISVRFLVRIMAVKEEQRVNGIIYVDQLRAVYGFTNDDFDSPIIQNCIPNNNGITTTTTQTISCDVTDVMSGVNKDATKFYLDEQEITNLIFTDIQGGYTVSWTPSSLIPLTKGIHKVKVRAEDNYGNYIVKEWTIIVDDSLPVFSAANESQIELNTECNIKINTTSLNFKQLNFIFNYDPEKVKDLKFVISELDFNVTENEVDESKGIIKFSITNNNVTTETDEICEIRFTPIVEGEISLSISDILFTVPSYQSCEFTQNDLIVKSESKLIYDFESFLAIVDSIDENNVLLSLENLSNAVNEMEKFDRDKVTDEEILAAINKVDLCLGKYQALVDALNSLNNSSNNVGLLVGGR